MHADTYLRLNFGNSLFRNPPSREAPAPFADALAPSGRPDAPGTHSVIGGDVGGGPLYVAVRRWRSDVGGPW